MAAAAGRARGWARVHALRWWLAALLALAVGYADLWRGGVALAPALLALAHVVLLPAAVLRR